MEEHGGPILQGWMGMLIIYPSHRGHGARGNETPARRGRTALNRKGVCCSPRGGLMGLLSRSYNRLFNKHWREELSLSL